MSRNNRSRINASYDEKNFFWVIYDSRTKTLIQNPSEEELKGTKLVEYNPTNICPLCREYCKKQKIDLTYKNILYPKNVGRDVNEEGERIEKWVCFNHAKNNYEKYNTGSTRNIIKMMTERRMGTLDYDRQMLADNSQYLTCELFGVDDLNKKNNNYNSPYDHNKISNHLLININNNIVDLCGKIPQSKVATFSRDIGVNGGYHFGFQKKEYLKRFDITILWCISEDRSHVEELYTFSKDDIFNTEKEMRKSITIVKNPTKVYKNYEKYKVTDQFFIDRANDLWKNLTKNTN